MRVTLLLLALVVLASSATTKPRNYEFRHSFKSPFFLSRGGTLPFWEVGGNTVVKEDAIQLTPARAQNTGKLYNMVAMEHENWEIEVQFHIGDGGRNYADGMAIWVVNAEDDINEVGPVFGMRENFKGIGIIVDTYDNVAGRSSPYLRIYSNDGTKAFDASQNGAALQVAEAPLSDTLRDRINKLRITYDQGYMSVDIDYDSMENFEPVINNVNVPMPSVTGERHFGISAATGNLYDAHSVVSFLTYSIVSDESNGSPQRDVGSNDDIAATDDTSSDTFESKSEKQLRLQREMEQREAEQERALYSRTGQTEELERLDREEDERRRQAESEQPRRTNEDSQRDNERLRDEQRREDERRRDELRREDERRRDEERRRDVRSSSTIEQSSIADLQKAIRSIELRLDALSRIENQGESLLRDLSRVNDRLRNVEGSTGGTDVSALASELSRSNKRLLGDIADKLQATESNIQRNTNRAGSGGDVMAKLNAVQNDINGLKRTINSLSDRQQELIRNASPGRQVADSSSGFGWIFYIVVLVVIAGVGIIAFRFVQKKNASRRSHFG